MRLFFQMGAITLVIVSAPFAGAVFLWAALKLVRARAACYRVALQSVLIGTATMVAAAAIGFRIVFHGGGEVVSAVFTTGLFAVIPALAACTFTVAKLLGTAVGKAAGAVGLAFVAGVVYFWLMVWSVPSLALTGGLIGSPLDYYRVLAEAPWRPIDYRITEIRVVAIGTVPGDSVDEVRRILAHDFQGMRVTVGDRLDLPAAAFDPTRAQYDAEALLPLLARRSEGRSVRVLGVADVDLFSPGLNFVFSSAQPKGAAAVMSLHDLRDPSDDVRGARYRKVALRVLGITFGFQSSLDRSCVMAFSNSLPALDEKGTAWCGSEPEALRKIQGLP